MHAFYHHSNQIIKKASPKAPKITTTFLDVVVLVVSNSSFPVDFYNDDDESPYFDILCVVAKIQRVSH